MVSVATTAGLGLISTMILISSLITKELVSAWTSTAENIQVPIFFRRLNRDLNLVIVPLLLTFAFIVATKVLEVLH